MKYGIIIWDNSPNSKIFTLQNRIVRTMAGTKPCINIFIRLDILPLPCENVFPLTNVIENNEELFQTNSTIHSVNTRNRNHLHRPFTKLSSF
jgi:hypothetical protein